MLIGLATGVVFGFVLEKSRVFEPGIIVGQMQLRSFIMLKVFLAAVIVGLLALAVMHGALGVKLSLKPLIWKADIIGGLILGAGIALAGACPGTSLAQVGAGYRDAIFVVLGGIAGAVFYGYFDQGITAFFAETGAKLTFAGLLGLPFWVVALAFASVLAVFLVMLERLVPWQQEMGENVDGVLPVEEAGDRPATGAARGA
jgi:uncharacterized membrane protein YedE/YeeE